MKPNYWPNIRYCYLHYFIPSMYNFYSVSDNRLTVSVGQQLHQAVKTRVSHLTDVGGTAADGLDSSSHKVFIHAFNICLPEKTFTQCRNA